MERAEAGPDLNFRRQPVDQIDGREVPAGKVREGVVDGLVVEGVVGGFCHLNPTEGKPGVPLEDDT